MAEIDTGYPAGGGAPTLAKDTQADPVSAIAKSSSYCGECGSWGAHGARCTCCGYDFYGDLIESPAQD